MPDELPTAEEAFGPRPLPTAEEAFGSRQDDAVRRQRQINTGSNVASPIQDFLFSNDGPVGTVWHSAGRVLDAFGHGTNDVGPAAPTSKEEEANLKKWVGFDDWSERSKNIARAANNVLLRPAVYDLTLAGHAMSGALAGGQAAVAQFGKEIGQEKLGREVAAIPEAFPTFDFRMGMPSPAAAELARARELGIIGPGGEAAWKGVAAPAEEAAKPTGVEPPIAEAPVQPIAAPPPPVAEVRPPLAAEPAHPADIHAAARQVDPDTFREYDALSQRRDTFRRWIDELQQTRDEHAAAEAPHAEEIADLQRRIADPDTTNRLRKKYEARLPPLLEENQTYIAEHTAAQSADMAKVRQRLQETDYAMRDLAPKVSAAYRGAQERFPELVPQAEPRAPEVTPATAAEVPQNINRANTVPYVAGASNTPSGLPVNIDHRVPAEMTIKGKTFAPDKYLTIHELDEHQRMMRGEPYETAHREALKAEQAAVEADGVDWNGYQEQMHVLAERIEKEPHDNPPPNLYTDPYPHKEAEFLKREAEHAKPTAPVVPTETEAPPVAAPAVEPRPPVEAPERAAPPGEPQPAPAPATTPPRTIEQQRDFIREDVARQLIRAGRSKEEAQAAGALIAARYETRAALFKGARGTAEDLYREEGAEILGQGMRSKQGPLPPRETKPRTVNEEKLSLLQFLAHRGGLKETADLRATIDKGDFVSGFGKLFRETGMTEDRAREAASEAGYLAENVERTGKQATIKELHEAIADEARGRKRYRQGYEPKPGELDEAEQEYLRESAERELTQAQPAKGLAPEAVEHAWANPKVLTATMRRMKFGQAADDIGLAVNDLSESSGTIRSHEADIAAITTDERAALKSGEAFSVEQDVEEERATAAERAEALREQIAKITNRAGNMLGREEIPSLDNPAVELSADGAEAVERAVSRQTDRGNVIKWGIDDLAQDVHDTAVELAEESEPERIAELKQELRSKIEALHDGAKKVLEEIDSRLTEGGATFEQSARGKINLIEGRRPIITLMRDANASTFIHESGHDFVEQMLRDARHELAPEQLKTDVRSMLDYVGAKEGQPLTTRQHEKLARAFEQYLREGTAPSPALANVFAQFRDWLVKIYQTIQGLGKPINDDIREVFDRMLAERPQRTVIAPEREPAKGFADLHEGEIEATHPEKLPPVLENVFAERHSTATEKLLPEEQNVRLTDVAAEDQKPPAGGAQPRSAGTEAGPLEREGGGDKGHGPVSEGRGEGLAESVGARTGKAAPAVASEPPATANAPFTGPKSTLIDKAGNIRLDKLQTPDDVTKVIKDAAAANDQFMSERRGVLSDIETLQLADAIGMDPAYLERKKIGEAFSVEEIRAARRLLVQSATAVRDAMIAAKDGSIEAIKAMAEAISTHEMIQSKVAQATAEAGRSLRAFRENIPGQENVALLDTWLKENTGRTLFQLQEMARLGSNLRTPQQVGRFVHDTAYGKIKQAIIFYYVNALISGPFTHLRYAAGNALTALWTPLVKIPAAVTYGTGRELVGFERDAERVYMGEAGAQLYGIMKGSREGLRAALEGWRTGTNPHLPGETVPNMFEAQPVMPPIPGTLGYILGLPGKSVGAIHGFFSALRYEQEVHGMAYREAMKEGLSGDAFTGRVTELADRPTQDMMQTAAAQARKDLYMAPADYQSFEAKLARIANHNLGTKVLLPFVKIGTQIVRTAMIESTPLGVFDKKVRANLTGENGNAAREMQAGQIIAGTALMGVMSGMVMEGMATGDGPSDPHKRAVWLLNHHPNSIQIGNLTVSYERLGALGMLMRTAANATETAHGWGDDQGHTIAMDFLYGTERAILGESFLTGIKDMIDAVYHYDEYGQSYLAQMITNWIPFSVGLGQTAKLSWIDPYKRETHASSLLDAIWKDAEAKVPWLSQSLMPKRDMFGEPIPQHGPVQNYENDPVVKAMNELHFGVGRLPRKVVGIELTDQQYDDYAKVAGRLAKWQLNAFVSTPGFNTMPPGMRVEQMHKIITDARQKAASMLKAENWDTIVRPSMEAKTVKRFGTPATAH